MTGGGFGARGRAIRILDVAEVWARGIDRRSRCTREKKKERRQDALTGQASVTKCKQILRFTRDDDVGVRSRAIVVWLPWRIDRRGHDISCPYVCARKRAD